jgi:hypothetical protein
MNRIAAMFVLLSLAIAWIVILGRGLLVMYGQAIAVLAAILAVGAGLAAVGAGGRGAAAARNRLMLLVVCVAILLGQFAFSLHVLGRTREYAKSPVTTSNLRGIGVAIGLYAADHGRYPDDFDALVAGGYSVPGQFIAVGDPDVPTDAGVKPVYSSFAYRPPAGGPNSDPAIILAYEREAWSPDELRVFPRYVRQVLFADGVCCG